MAISEWDRRQLCPDGACIGIIGPDGTCKECGRVAPDWGDERRRGLVAADEGEGEGEEDEEEDDEQEDELSPSAPAAIGEAREWLRRRLCTNGACIGVIGEDGRCKVCGVRADDGKEGEEEDEEEDADDEDLEDEAEDGEEDEERAADDEEDEEEEDEEEDDEEEEDEEEDDDEADEEADDADRKLCPDGACIGVLGTDGRCKVCGKEAA